ncbi:Uma2 family endonuclease [Mucilaginibacter limnophilus]|uniref:Uma2 family endonuclease n=1 Tax=Mucilaginibacter limnophilus TaxID=1932778 RepID=A0A437MKS5_9SPHI|nr:Uma2 family endonuclease [Mucilaginibacter limnophilus]RVT98274.1 Uma2 family endonuclease [Mucilaginibacter limnophilus]
MKHIIDTPPRTAMEVFNLLPEGTLCEVIDNVLYMSPSPTTNHQRILLDIVAELKIYIKTNKFGEAFISPCDVYLDNEQSVVQPDIIFLKAGNDHMVQRKGIYGSPDLMIEILSSNKKYDREEKYALYQRNGVAEYIMIDSDTKEVWPYILVKGSYEPQPILKGEIYIHQLQLSISF